MQQEEGIVVILIIVLLIVCYFTPLTFNNTDNFTNLLKEFPGIVPAGYLNPQGSIGNIKSSFNPGPAVTQARWNPGNVEKTKQTAPGTIRSLNMGQDGTMSSFPFMEQSRTSNNEVINLIKPDGVILGGYVPQIIRPFDSTTAFDPNNNKEGCNWPCYSNLKYQKWCNEDDAINYYAMRPLVNPTDYNKRLKKLFNIIIDRDAPQSLLPSDDKYAAVFCTENQSNIMSWLMQKIALGVSKMPEMQKNGPWKSERFYETDVQLYEFADNGQIHFKVIFNLYNPLRSVSTLVVATVFIVSGKPILRDIDFVNDGEMGDYMAPENGWGPINGQNITPTEKYGMSIEQFEPLGFKQTPEGMQMWEEFYKKDPNEFDWNYQNTLEVQKFNKYGFYSNVPSENIEIEGGVPDALKDKLKFCKEENLMSCATPGFTGITAVSAKSLNEKYGTIDKLSEQKSNERMAGFDSKSSPPPFKNINVPLNGDVYNVYTNPNYIYSVPTLGLRDSKIDGIVQKDEIVSKFYV